MSYIIFCTAINQECPHLLSVAAIFCIACMLECHLAIIGDLKLQQWGLGYFLCYECQTSKGRVREYMDKQSVLLSTTDYTN